MLVDGFDPEGVLDIIEDEAISVLPVAPPVFAYWMQVPGLEDRLGPVRMILSGSAPLSPELTEAFTERTGLAIHQGYGLTEAAPVVTSGLCSKVPNPRSVGRRAARHRDPARRRARPCARGGRRRRDPRSAATTCSPATGPTAPTDPTPDGWWPTGDVGYLDADGDLFLVDRLKDLVIVSGFNVYPSEVEDVITELESVAQAAVIGVDDPLTGEAVVAYVKPAGEVEAEQLAEQVRAHCAGRLAGFKQPRTIHVTDDLPSTVTGKVQKGRLRATERRRALGLLES